MVQQHLHEEKDGCYSTGFIRINKTVLEKLVALGIMESDMFENTFGRWYIAKFKPDWERALSGVVDAPAKKPALGDGREIGNWAKQGLPKGHPEK
jgi:hypothetical protein